MKTTMDISDGLLAEAKRLAAKKRITFRALMESALREKLESERSTAKPFKLRKHTFRGKGLQPGLTEGNWGEIRERIYEGRGA